MPLDPTQDFASDPTQQFAGESQKPAFDPTKAFSEPEKPAFDESKPFQPADAKPAFDPSKPFDDLSHAPQFTAYEKATAAAGAELYTAPKQFMQFIDYVDHLFYKPVDAVLGTNYSDQFSQRIANRQKEIDAERGFAQEASGTGDLAQLSAGFAQQLTQLPVQMATGGVGNLVKGIKGAIAASSIFGGLQSAATSFSENVEKRVAAGQDVHEAANAELIPSLTSGAITAAVTRGFGSSGIESVFKQTGAKGVVGRFANTLREGGMEIAEEVTDEAAQIMNDLINNQKVTPQDAFNRVKQTVYLSGIMGGGAAGIHNVTEAAQERALGRGAEQAQALEAAGAPETAKAVREDAVQNAAILEAVPQPAPEAAPTTEAQPAPPDIRLTTEQQPDGTFSHNLQVGPETSIDQLQAWQKAVDLRHLPTEAQQAVQEQINAAIAQRQAAAPPVQAAELGLPITAAPAAEAPAVEAASPQAAPPPAIIPAEGSPVFGPQIAGEHVISTAINTPEGLLQGSKWNESHDGIGVRHGIFEVPQSQRGFIVQDSQGNQRFVGGSEAARSEAGRIAKAAGQTIVSGENLQSADLTEFAKGLPEAIAAAPQVAKPGLAKPREGSPLEAGATPTGGEGTQPVPSVAQVAKEAAVPRTPEEKAAKIEQGRTEQTAQALETGIIPLQKELHAATGSSTEGSKLGKELKKQLATAFPPEPLAKGDKETTDKSRVTGDELPSVIQSDGIVRPKFTNDPTITAQQLDAGQRVVIPQSLLSPDYKVNPAITLSVDKKTGEKYVSSVNAQLPDGSVQTFTGPDEYSEAYKKATAFEGRAQKAISLEPEILQAVQDQVGEDLRNRGIEHDPLDFDETAPYDETQRADLPTETEQEEAGNVDANESLLGPDPYTAEIPAVEFPSEAIRADYLKKVLTKNIEDLSRLGIAKLEGVVDPIRVALKAISTDKTQTKGIQKLAKKLLTAKVDWTKVQLRMLDNTNSGAPAGFYSGSRVDVEKGRIDLNRAGDHRGGIAATLLHEAVHHLTLRKLDPNYARNPFEQKAYEQILKYYDKALAYAYEKATGKKGSKADLEKFAKGQGDLRFASNNREFYGVSNPREFIAETLSSNRFQKFLSEIEGEGTVRGKVGNLLNSIRESLKRFITGEDVKKGSLMDNALDDAFKLLQHPQTNEQAYAGLAAATAKTRPQDKYTNMTRIDLVQEFRNRYPGEELPVDMTTDEIRDALGGKVTNLTSVGQDEIPDNHYGWLTPDGKFHSAKLYRHGDEAELIIEANPKLQKKYYETYSSEDFAEETLSKETGILAEEFLLKNGYVRVAGGPGNTTTYIQGKPTRSQLSKLKDAAIAKGVELRHDIIGSPNGKLLYSPGNALSGAAPRPVLTHTIGADGNVVHGINIPDEASVESLEASLAQIDSAAFPYADMARLKGQVNEAIEFKSSQANPVDLTSDDPGKFKQWMDKTAKRIISNFKAEGDLPTDVFRRWQQREGDVKAISRDIAYTTRDFYRALREVYKIGTGERVLKGYSEIPTADIDNMNNFLLGKTAAENIPEAIRGPLTEMRQHIDRFSQILINEGLATDDLAVKVADNLGTYLTRSYRIFDDPKWANKIPKDVRNRAKAFLLSEMRKDNPAATAEDAQRKMDAMLEDWRVQGDNRFDRSPGKLGSQDFSTFIKRKDIAPELRALMGEYTDPVTNYARSVTKMASLIANNRFLKDVKEAGLGKYLFEDGTQPPGFTAQIAAEGSQPMAPLNGLRTTPEIADAFQEFQKAVNPGGPLFKAYMGATAIAKGSKTVGSGITQMRNAIGQAWFFAMNGHFNMAPLKEALAGTASDIGLIQDSPKWRSFYKNMLRMNIVDQSAKAGELRDIMNDAGVAGVARVGEPTKAGALRTFGKNLYTGTIGAATRAYQISDDVGKVVGFMNERKRQARMMNLDLQDPTDPNWVPNAADIKAAEIISLTYPTYSMVPNAIKNLRRQPVFGPFMTFSYEALRTAYHNLALTGQYMREAAKPGANPEYRKAAAQRLGGQLAVLGGASTLLTMGLRAMLGMTAKEEEDARKFLPEWDKNAQLAFVGKEKGQLDYINMSYQNPYSYITDPVLAAIRAAGEGDGAMEAIVQAGKEFLEPFANESVLAGAVVDILRNKTATGREVYNPADTRDQKIRAVLGRLWESVEPGTLTRTRKRFIPAARGETRQNLKLDLGQELTSELTGFKRQTLDYKSGIGFKASDFVDNERNSEKIFRSVALREGNVNPQEIIDTYNRAEGQRFRIWKDLHEVAAAGIRQGLSGADIRRIFKAWRVSADDTNRIIRGQYKPFRPTAAMRTQLRVKLKRQLPLLVSPYAGKRLTDAVPTQQEPVVQPPVGSP